MNENEKEERGQASERQGTVGAPHLVATVRRSADESGVGGIRGSGRYLSPLGATRSKYLVRAARGPRSDRRSLPLKRLTTWWMTSMGSKSKPGLELACLVGGLMRINGYWISPVLS